MNKKAGIIGSGIGGLALSIRLAKAGYDVTCFYRKGCQECLTEDWFKQFKAQIRAEFTFT